MRYVPRTYNNRRLLRFTFAAVVSVALAALVMFLALFFGLRRYETRTPDGQTVLEIPFLMQNPTPREEGRPSSLTGLLIGLTFGATQHIMLSKYVGSSTERKMNLKAAFFVLFQFLLPIVVLLVCTLLLTDGPLLVGVGMIVSIILLSIAQLINKLRINKKLPFQKRKEN